MCSNYNYHITFDTKKELAEADIVKVTKLISSCEGYNIEILAKTIQSIMTTAITETCNKCEVSKS